MVKITIIVWSKLQSLYGQNYNHCMVKITIIVWLKLQSSFIHIVHYNHLMINNHIKLIFQSTYPHLAVTCENLTIIIQSSYKCPMIIS
jgi:hypothetical protein